jgi:hypothetical protein
MDALLPILDWVLPVVSAILVIVLSALAKKHIGKLGLERSEKIDAMIDDYVGKGVKAAERAGQAALAAQGAKLPGSTKKAKAVKVVLAELEQSGLKDVGVDLITARIEAFLEDTDPKVSTGGEDSTTV